MVPSGRTAVLSIVSYTATGRSFIQYKRQIRNEIKYRFEHLHNILRGKFLSVFEHLSFTVDVFNHYT